MKLKLPIYEKTEKKFSYNFAKNTILPSRTLFLGFLFLIASFFLLIRLFQITITKGQYYRLLAENNRIKEILLEPKRGTLYDRKNIPVAFSKKVKHAYKRMYPFGEILSHSIGYRQIASKEDIVHDICKSPLYKNDFVGKSGIERLFECDLRGQKGKQLVELDSKRAQIHTLSIQKPIGGNDITLSLDSDLQQKMDNIIKNNEITSDVKVTLKDKSIVAIATKPQTGEILMMYSYPTFNPDVFESNITVQKNVYLKDLKRPLINRALLGTYPPGSIFKPIIATAGLEEKVISAKTLIEDMGFIKAGPRIFNNWLFTQYGRTDGMVDMRKALTRSNDIYFYTLGGKLGEDKIKKWASQFGLATKTNIGLPEETSTIPTSFWKLETIKERWYLGDTYNLSIGQGYLLVTPIQIHSALSVFANNGYLCKPELKKITNNKLAFCKKIPISDDSLLIIKEGMKGACSSGGTAWPFFTFGIQEQSIKQNPSPTINNATSSAQTQPKLTPMSVGCKTGTAESKHKGAQPHAWFYVFAPYENPEISLTILVEESGEGSSVAAPIAKTLLKYYFERVQ